MTQEFKDIFEKCEQESMSEILRKQRFALSLSQLPYVSDEEQADIEKCFGSPSGYNREDYIDATDWLLGRKELKDL